MANNRMYIVCRECEGFVSIAKTLGDGWYTNGPIDLNDFFKEHDHVSKLEDGFGSKQFALVFEVDDPQVRTYDFSERKIRLSPTKESEEK